MEKIVIEICDVCHTVSMCVEFMWYTPQSGRRKGHLCMECIKEFKNQVDTYHSRTNERQLPLVVGGKR